MFTSILNSAAGSLSVSDALICTAVSAVIGLVIAAVYLYSGKCTKSFAVTIVLLPIITQVIIMMVNGNLGAGVAVMGAFSLIRFRSAPGSSKEIAVIFLAMVAGLATGMGYVTFAALFTVIICGIFLVLCKTGFAENTAEKTLRVTIPESLDYTGAFDDIFNKYTKKVSLDRVKTTNLGSMIELSYTIQLADVSREKDMIDELRCRNGNLTIICARAMTNNDAL